jgi:hypothetical protein
MNNSTFSIVESRGYLTSPSGFLNLNIDDMESK